MSMISKIARQLLEIDEDIPFRKNRDVPLENYELFTFVQCWGSTAGGFEGIGGCTITEQRTFVFASDEANECLVYFGGSFAYKAPIH